MIHPQISKCCGSAKNLGCGQMDSSMCTDTARCWKAMRLMFRVQICSAAERFNMETRHPASAIQEAIVDIAKELYRRNKKCQSWPQHGPAIPRAQLQLLLYRAQPRGDMESTTQMPCTSCEASEKIDNGDTSWQLVFPCSMNPFQPLA